MKGNVYTCSEEQVPVVAKYTVRGFNLTTGSWCKVKFYSHETFMMWMADHGFGIKLFEKKEDLDYELSCVDVFVNEMVIASNYSVTQTCLAFAFDRKKREEIVWSDVKQINGLLLMHMKGTALDQAPLLMKSDPLKWLRRVWRTTETFLMTLHSKDVHYGDIKCENILITESDDVVIGDYGSIRCTDKLNLYTRTFYPPTSSKFKSYWTDSDLDFAVAFNMFKDEGMIDDIVHNWKRAHSRHDRTVDMSKAVDWFHFGIAMVQLIYVLNDPTLFKMVECILDRFCYSPYNAHVS